MAKLTVSEIKRQIAALEAKAARLAEEEATASVGKVRALMNQLGVTLEHLSSTVSRKASAVKKAIVGKRATAKRTSKGVAKYRDPKTGATWSGFGRAPGWIAGVTSRDAFLVGKSGGNASEAVVKETGETKKSAAKKSATKKIVKPAAKKAVATAKRTVAKAATPAAKKKSSAKTTGRKTAAKKVAKKRAASNRAAVAPAAAESGAPSA